MLKVRAVFFIKFCLTSPPVHVLCSRYLSRSRTLQYRFKPPEAAIDRDNCCAIVLIHINTRIHWEKKNSKHLIFIIITVIILHSYQNCTGCTRVEHTALNKSNEAAKQSVRPVWTRGHFHSFTFLLKI